MHVSKVFLLLSLAILILSACQGNGDVLKADAGQDFTVVVGAAPSFDGCASTGDIVNYKWTIISAPDEMIDDNGKVIREVDSNCKFTLDASMGFEEMGDWVIELEVRDSGSRSDTDTVDVAVVE